MIENWPGWPPDRTAIVAEIGLNHGGDETLAWKMIQSAYNNGADFVKLQTFVMEDFFHSSLPYYNNIKNMGLSSDAQKRLFKKAANKNIKLITTPFDRTTVDLTEEFNPPTYKVASMDNDNTPLIRYIAEKNRPVIVSCGMADLDEIQRVVQIMEEAGNKKLVLLHCISDYPTKIDDLNLSMIRFLSDTFGYPVGLSDHSIGLHSSFVAASLSAAVIEKHFTTDRSLKDKYPDADNDISILPHELKELRIFCESVRIMRGKIPRQFTANEQEGRLAYRRGLYARRDIKAGEKISLKNTVFLRPVKGIKAGDWDNVVGKEIKKSISKYQPITYSDLGL